MFNVGGFTYLGLTLSRRQIDHVQMHVLVTAIVLQSKWYVVRYFQHANCLSLHVYSRVCTYSLCIYVGNVVIMQLLPKCVTN